MKKGNGMNLATLLAAGGYGWGFLHLLKNHLASLLISQWELVLGYVIFTGLLGCICVSFIRGNEGTKHITRVAAKWLLRITAVMFIYNASASPSTSIAWVLVCLGVYVVQKVFTPKAGYETSKGKHKGE